VWGSSVVGSSSTRHDGDVTIEMTAGRVGEVIAQLQELLPGRCTTSETERVAHGTDESFHTTYPPDAVVFPTSVEEVQAIVRTCAAHDVPIIPYGAGTSIEGHISAVHGGITIDMSRMDKVLAIRPNDLDATVQAGVTRMALNDALVREGLFFSVDPGADASLGGMAATRASGRSRPSWPTAA
jgi:D-lactate dehydrogenase (cytochrome)